MSSRPKIRVLGRHVVSDPRICHGKPTFRGTRVRVEDVLEQVASGMAWETIIEEWNRSVTVEAIREAVQLASQALAKQGNVGEVHYFEHGSGMVAGVKFFSGPRDL